jgi:ribonuclease Z
VVPDQVRSSFAPAIRLAFAGDSSSWEQLAKQVSGVDLLVGEATYLRRDESLARRNGHLTAEELALAARQAGVRWLVGTHLSQRYRPEEYLEELREVFPQSVVAEDFLSVRLTHAGELVQGPYHKVRPPGCG